MSDVTRLESGKLGILAEAHTGEHLLRVDEDGCRGTCLAKGLQQDHAASLLSGHVPGFWPSAIPQSTDTPSRQLQSHATDVLVTNPVLLVPV